MKTITTARGEAGAEALPPRERILASARGLFYRNGFHAVGVDAIAEAAGTNKMTLYRHFPSKDDLIVQCLRQIGAEIDAAWAANATRHAGDPKGQLVTWLGYIAEFKLTPDERGCAFVNAAIEHPDRGHPVRRVVEEFKSRHRRKIIELCREAGLTDPEILADQLFLLIEGARVCRQSFGDEGPATRCKDLLQSLVKAHQPRDGVTPPAGAATAAAQPPPTRLQ